MLFLIVDNVRLYIDELRFTLGTLCCLKCSRGLISTDVDVLGIACIVRRSESSSTEWGVLFYILYYIMHYHC
jgi:hypothetical protein